MTYKYSYAGGIELDSPFLLAPLAGVTGSAFRQICGKHGAGLCCSEMVSCKGLYYGGKGSDQLTFISGGEGPAAIQLFGSEPEMFSFAARELKSRPNVIIDINMGCPVPKVVKNGEGSALLKDPELAAQCVRAAAAAAGKPVTVKMRKGFSAPPSPGEIGAPAMAEVLAEAGAAAVTVHGRTRDQYYSGKADWDSIKAVCERSPIPVVGNGDVFTAEDAVRMMDYTGCRFVMIARGAMGNPWIFEQAKALLEGRPVPAKPDVQEIIDTVKEHLMLLIEEKGEYTAVREMRGHAAWYTKGIRGAARLRAELNAADSPDRLIEIISKLKEKNNG